MFLGKIQADLKLNGASQLKQKKPDAVRNIEKADTKSMVKN